jgi:hypothetical protein
MCCFWRNCGYVYESKISRYEGTVLAANLDEPIIKTKDLIPQIKEVMGFLARNTMEKYSKRFRSRIEAAVTADDNFVE